MTIPFWQIANDGNLLPSPLQVNGVVISVAERMDIVIDFSQFKPGTTLYLEDRMNQVDGRGPVANVGAPLALVPQARATSSCSSASAAP